MTRTVSRALWEAAQASWGGFSTEWHEVRHQMAMQGVIFAPSGTEWDSWDDDSPSQRAILIRAIRETPEMLAECASRARSWSDLVRLLLSARDRRRSEIDAADRDRERQAEADREAYRASLRRLADVLATIADSGSPS